VLTSATTVLVEVSLKRPALGLYLLQSLEASVAWVNVDHS
jgi:hypothetical protein